MSKHLQRSLMPVGPEALDAWHARPGCFERLAPPLMRPELLESHGHIEDGATKRFVIRVGPFPIEWLAEHRNRQEGLGFTDFQVRGPFAEWVHDHRALPGPDGQAILEDEVRYRLPLGPLGALAQGHTAKKLSQMFAFRHARTALDLARHAPYAARPRLSVAITGASGLVGQALTAFLRSGGHEVWPLVRRPVRPGESAIAWDPKAGTIEAKKLEGLDAVVHLAGENIGASRWSPQRKAEILASRIDSTRLIASTLASLGAKPKVLLSASAVGYFGDTEDRRVDENHTVAGRGFLAEVCQSWELAANAAREAGIRVVHPRFGVVLDPSAGALGKMLPIFKAGLGGRIGTGEQYMSWIGLDDAVGALHHALWTESLEGPVHLVGEPVTNAEFTATLAKVLHRPAFFPVPIFALAAAFGEMGQALLLESQRVAGVRLAESGFALATPKLEEALMWALGQVPAHLVPPAAAEGGAQHGG